MRVKADCRATGEVFWGAEWGNISLLKAWLSGEVEVVTVNHDLARQFAKPLRAVRSEIAVQTMIGHVCFGIESNPAYGDVAVQRLQDFTGETAVLESSGEYFDGGRNSERPEPGLA